MRPGESVLVVCHYYPPHVGGVEVVAQQQAHGLARAGYRVQVLTCDGNAAPGVSDEGGVTVRRVRSWKRLERYGVPFPVCSPTLAWHAYRAVRHADLVHVHDALYLTSWVAALVCQVLRRPYVVSRHVGVVDHPSRLVRIVQDTVNATVGTVVVRGARMVLPIDTYVATFTGAGARSGTRVRVLPNAVDVARFRPCSDADEKRRIRKEFGLPSETPLVLFVGRPVPKKGYPVVKAAESEHYALVFVGGPRRPGTESAPVAGRAFHLGQMDQADVARVYRACDVFVGASVGEAPLTTREAMASGLPVVLNDDPAYRALGLPDRTAVHLQMETSVSLRQTLESLVRDIRTTQERGRASRRYAARVFSWPAHIERLVTIYREVLALTEYGRTGVSVPPQIRTPSLTLSTRFRRTRTWH